MILSVTLNPSLDQTLFLRELRAGDTNRVERVEMDAGGKGLNLSRIAAGLGAKTVATGFLGGGPSSFILSVCAREGVEAQFIPIRGETRTNVGIELTNGDPPTTLNARGPEIQVDEWQALCAHIRRLVHQSDWLCLSGSLPPGVADSAYAELAAIAHEAGKKALIDADGQPMLHGIEARPDCVKPNAKEASRLLGHPVEGLDGAIAAVRELHERMGGGDRIALISLGEDGAVMCSASGVFRGVSPKIEPVSTIGAGDSMLGGLLASLQRGDDPAVAFQWGLAAGAATATTTGAHIGQRSVIELLFDQAQVVRLD